MTAEVARYFGERPYFERQFRKNALQISKLAAENQT
jgi:hypothetical protein